jgi:hypothetical protein
MVSAGSTLDMSLNLPIVSGLTLSESLPAGGSARAELTKPSKTPNKTISFDKRKMK